MDTKQSSKVVYDDAWYNSLSTRAKGRWYIQQMMILQDAISNKNTYNIGEFEHQKNVDELKGLVIKYKKDLKEDVLLEKKRERDQIRLAEFHKKQEEIANRTDDDKFYDSIQFKLKAAMSVTDPQTETPIPFTMNRLASWVQGDLYNQFMIDVSVDGDKKNPKELNDLLQLEIAKRLNKERIHNQQVLIELLVAIDKKPHEKQTETMVNIESVLTALNAALDASEKTIAETESDVLYNSMEYLLKHPKKVLYPPADMIAKYRKEVEKTLPADRLPQFKKDTENVSKAVELHKIALKKIDDAEDAYHLKLQNAYGNRIAEIDEQRSNKKITKEEKDDLISVAREKVENYKRKYRKQKEIEIAQVNAEFDVEYETEIENKLNIERKFYVEQLTTLFDRIANKPKDDNQKKALADLRYVLNALNEKIDPSQVKRQRKTEEEEEEESPMCVIV
jgi:hypothetical protein